MGTIQFVRGTDISLPQDYHDGAIFIIGNTSSQIKPGYYQGDMYVDIGNNQNSKRFCIRPNDAIYYGTPEQFGQGAISEEGRVYGLVTNKNSYNYVDKNGMTKTAYLPIMIIGDGVTPIIDLPQYNSIIVDDDKAFWNQKVTAVANGEELVLSATYCYLPEQIKR